MTLQLVKETMAEGPSDASLVVAIGRFDESALATVYERHGGAVFALARRLIRRRDLAEEVTQEIFNVGSGGTYSVNTLVKLIGGEVTHIPKRPGEPDCTYADISTIRKVLGWEPKIKFEDGVKELMKHIELWKDAPVWTPESIQEATADWFKYLDK